MKNLKDLQEAYNIQAALIHDMLLSHERIMGLLSELQGILKTPINEDIICITCHEPIYGDQQKRVLHGGSEVEGAYIHESCYQSNGDGE